MSAPDFASLAPETADRLTKAQQVAVLLMSETEPLKQRSSGLPGSTFKVLRSKGLAQSRGEVEWTLTVFGGQVRKVLIERGATALG